MTDGSPATAPASERPGRPPRGPAARPGFRPEIQGLRGLAILLVVAYHLWTSGRVSGGVDVFLFISAFLMTGSFVRKGTAFKLVDFLVQRFRRLVPMASIVVVATLIAGVLLQTPTRYPGLVTNAIASLLYRENWQLIADATDYTAPNPLELNAFQHFWSLSVQGQLFVLMPLLFIACALAERRFGLPIRRTVGVALALATVVSFAYAVHLVEVAPAEAYFSTWARAWEFTAAGLLAALPAWTPPRRLSVAMSWAGLGLLLITGIVWGRGDFPGVAALPPLIAAALVVFAGPSRAPYHAAWWLSLRPVTFVANRAYTLYLWHWPVYVFYLDVTETTNPRTGVVGSIIVIALSFLLADLSTRLVERRFHGLAALKQRSMALTAILVFSLIGASVIGGVAALVERDTRATAGLSPEERPGARVLTASPTPSLSSGPGRRIAPGDSIIAQDWPVQFPTCVEGAPGMPPHPELGWCAVYEKGIEPPTKTIAVVGDSHAYQWLTAIVPLASSQNWRVIAYVRPACRVGSPSEVPGCPEYTAETVQWLLDLKPDYVVSTGSSARSDAPEHDDWGWAEAIAPVARAGVTIVNIRDNPRWEVNMPECVQRFGADDPRCFARRSDKLAEQWPVGALAGLPNQRYLDFSDWFCPPGKVSICPGVIGNTYVYMDTNHLSRAYVETLVEVFDEAWRREVGVR